MNKKQKLRSEYMDSHHHLSESAMGLIGLHFSRGDFTKAYEVYSGYRSKLLALDLQFTANNLALDEQTGSVEYTLDSVRELLRTTIKAKQQYLDDSNFYSGGPGNGIAERFVQINVDELTKILHDLDQIAS